jgi:DNA mismatch endonuclease, patch repair protein
MDRLSPSQRSQNMSRIRSSNTAPERIARSVVHCLGYRFSLKSRHLPGKPDLVLLRLRTVVFVHGCFWHCHTCVDGHIPKSRNDYWAPKLQKNAQRDLCGRATFQVQVCGYADLWHPRYHAATHSKPFGLPMDLKSINVVKPIL